MAEPMRQGFDQTCGTCYGARVKPVEKITIIDGKSVSMTVSEVCTTCHGAGRIGGQTQ